MHVNQSKLLDISHSSVYSQSTPVPEEDVRIMRLMGELHLKRPFLGSRRMVDELAEHGVKVNRKKVQKLMRLTDIKALYPKPRTKAQQSREENTR